MEWKEQGLILSARAHGETSAIVELMTSAHGRHLGLVRGGRSRRMRPVLQPGNTVDATWRARLDEHLGAYLVEPVRLRTAQLMASATGIYGVQTLAAHLRLLPERDPHPNLFDAAMVLLDHLDDPLIAACLLVRFEVALLDELGFGLDLSSCAVTADTGNLAWVSPKSGRAVSRQAGEAWADKLLDLPAFLSASPDRQISADARAVEAGFELTRYFLTRDVYGPRGIDPPPERAGLIARTLSHLEAAPPSG